MAFPNRPDDESNEERLPSLHCDNSGFGACGLGFGIWGLGFRFTMIWRLLKMIYLQQDLFFLRNAHLELWGPLSSTDINPRNPKPPNPQPCVTVCLTGDVI